MNWLTNYVKPKIQKVLNKRETPDNLWHKCKQCEQMIYQKEYVTNLSVCASCGHHGRIGPDERFNQLFDQHAYEPIAMPEVVADPLKFKDSKRYNERMKTARSATGDQDAIKAAYGKLNGVDAVVVVQNFFFMGGSMGMAVGESFLTAVDYAVAKKAPLVMFTAAGGARMQEGILSLMQMPRTTIGIQLLHEEGLPYIVVLTDPTTGGVTASYAMLGDVQIAEPGALIGFAGPRVIEQNLRETLPEGFQRSEYLLEHGMIDMITTRADLKGQLSKVITLLMAGQFKTAAE